MKQPLLRLPFCNAFVPFITLVLSIASVFVSPNAIAAPSGDNNQPVVGKPLVREIAPNAVDPRMLPHMTDKGIVHIAPNAIASDSGKNDRLVGNTKSPTLGKPYIELHIDPHGINPGVPLNISGRDFPVGAKIALSLDGHLVKSITVEPNGRFTAQLIAPQELGAHTLVATDSATGHVLDGLSILVRRGGEDEEDRRKEKLKKR